MKLILTTLLFILTTTIGAYGQNPGNVGTANLSAWFKPDALPLGNVTSWTTTLSSIGGVTVTDASAPFPQATNTPVGNVSNYNTTLYFNGNTTSTLQALQNTAALNLLSNSSSASQGTFFCAYYLPTGATYTNGHMMLYNSTPNAIQFRNLGATGRIAIGLTGQSTNATRNWTETNEPTIISYKGNRSTSTSFKAYENDLLFTTTTASQSSGPTGLYFGVMPGTGTSPYNGYIHEYIFYNSDLSDADIRKVNTYLAIKYGATLGNTGGGTQGDYVASNNVTIWDASVSPSHHNDVIGIGRDDNQALMQKQSHSFADDFRIYLATLAPNNVSNIGTFTSDTSFITMGHDAATCGTPLANAESPAGLSSRLGEEWKVQNTNFTQTFNWDVKVDTCNTPGFAVGPVNLADLRLLVDNDGDFSNATMYAAGGGLSFSYNNGYITVSGISNTHLPKDSIRFFTIGYNTITASFTGANSICVGETVPVTVNIQGASSPINITYSDGTSNYTLTNVSDGHVFNVSPTTTTTYTIQGYKSFLDCCGGGGGGPYTIAVSPYPTVTANASINPLCEGQSTTLSGAGATTYTWTSGYTNGTSIAPTATFTDTVIGVNVGGCADTAVITVVVNPKPTVVANSTATTICQGTPITLTGSGATSYLWSNGVVNGIQFTPMSTTTYAVSGTDANNCTNIASITITVVPAPAVLAHATDSIICVGESTTLYGSGATAYVWNNGVVNNVPFSPTVSGMYTVVGTNSNNCPNIDSVYITVNPNPTVTAVATPPFICFGDSSQLLASGANTYTWTPTVNNGDSVSPSATSSYTVIGTSAAGCTGTASVTVNVNPLPPVVANANPIVVCEGGQTTLTGSGATSYTWTNGVTDNVPFTPTTTANYTVTGTDGTNCSNTDDVTVVVVPKPFFTIGPDTTTCPQNPAILSANTSFSSYLWSTGETTPVISVGNVGTVTLTVTDDDGCVYTDNLVLFLSPDCFPTYNIPNVFTPNGDNNNDFFFIEATNISSQTITILNRWNNVMFSKTGPQPIWDGRTADGAVATDGVYFVQYILNADNGEILSGTAFLHLVSE
jgi:gliding motility-associated-like protein